VSLLRPFSSPYPSFLGLLPTEVVYRQQVLRQAASPPDAEVRKDGIDASPPPCASSLASTFPGAGAPKIKIPRESLRVGSEPGDKHVGTATCRQTSISVTRQARSHRPLTQLCYRPAWSKTGKLGIGSRHGGWTMVDDGFVQKNVGARG